MNVEKLFVVFLFFITYILLVTVAKGKKGLLVLFTGVVLLWLTAILSLKDIFSFINFNVLGIFWGTMVLSELFVSSGVPAYLATQLVSRTKTLCFAILSVCFLSGLISSFTENVATVLIVAPIAFEIARRLKVTPTPFLIGIAISSNLQGTATLIGDPPSIILASFGKLNFTDFFWFQGKPGIAFAVELGALASLVTLYLLFKKYSQRIVEIERVKIKTLVPTVLMGLMILGLIVASLIPDGGQYSLAIICVVFGLMGLIWQQRRHAQSLSIIGDLDWQTLFFLAGVFILIGSLTKVGILQDIARFILKISKGSPFLAYSIIVWFSVLVSAFVDNVPYTIAMLPVAKIVAGGLGVPMYPFIFGLVIGATVGGNISPIGAAANIVAIGQLRQRGITVAFRDFVKIGLPFTISAVTVAYLFVWIVWSM